MAKTADTALMEGLTKALKEATAGANEAIAQTAGALREVRESSRVLISDSDQRVIALRAEVDGLCKELKQARDENIGYTVAMKRLENERALQDAKIQKLGEGLGIIKSIGLALVQGHIAAGALGGGKGTDEESTVEKIPPIEAEIDALTRDLSPETLRILYGKIKPALLPHLASPEFLGTLVPLIDNEVIEGLKKDLGQPAWAVRFQKIARAAGFVK